MMRAFARLPVALTLATWMGVSAEEASYDRGGDPHGFTVFMKEGGWCWFQDPRAVIHDGQLLIGSVRGNGDGPALIGVYDLEKEKRRETFVAHAEFDRDDHNSPVFHARPDGSVLAMYARHSREQVHYYRISDPEDVTAWGTERIFRHDYLGKDKVTYMNLHYLEDEGTLYNFFRGFDFNPSFITSTDHGQSWGGPTHFIKSELEGRHRPYARYVDNGDDTIHVSFTDGHPHRFGNSIYYAAFRGGAFHRADGTLIKDLAEEGPLTPREAERVYKGSGRWAPEPTRKGVRPSADRAAWTSSIALDAQGRPHIGYSLHLTRDDLRYRLASWNGRRWIDREVARAGTALYDRETSYTGLITLDPVDPTLVIISSDVDPTTGEDHGGQHEIYRATIEPDDDIESIQWQPVTRKSPVRNLRPVILRDGDRRVVLWNRGVFKTFTNYQLDTVGFIESVAD